jgi:hypothetical protein
LIHAVLIDSGRGGTCQVFGGKIKAALFRTAFY